MVLKKLKEMTWSEALRTPEVGMIQTCRLPGRQNQVLLDSVLFQQEAVVYASRTLTDCELKYAPVDPECLLIVFPATKLDQYIMFVHPDVTTHTDHKPLG